MKTAHNSTNKANVQRSKLSKTSRKWYRHPHNHVNNLKKLRLRMKGRTHPDKDHRICNQDKSSMTIVRTMAAQNTL